MFKQIILPVAIVAFLWFAVVSPPPSGTPSVDNISWQRDLGFTEGIWFDWVLTSKSYQTDHYLVVSFATSNDENFNFIGICGHWYQW